jgi:hypothetical protein
LIESQRPPDTSTFIDVRMRAVSKFVNIDRRLFMLYDDGK